MKNQTIDLEKKSFGMNFIIPNTENDYLKYVAKKIAIYQGFKGTDKQVERYLKMYGNSIELMKQYAKNRFVI